MAPSPDANVISDVIATALATLCKTVGAPLTEAQVVEIKTHTSDNNAIFHKVAKIYHDSFSMDETAVLDSLIHSSQTPDIWSTLIDIPEVQHNLEKSCRAFGRGRV